MISGAGSRFSGGGRKKVSDNLPGGFGMYRSAELLIWVAILLFGLLLARGFLFHPGLLMSGDNPVHQAEIIALQETVLGEQGWWSGWYEGDFAGYPLLVYQYPLGKWLVVFLAAVPGIGLSWAYKAGLWFSWLFPVLVAVRMLARRGYSIIILAVSAALYLSCFDSFLLSLAGMWNQYLSAGLFLLALDMILRLLAEEGPWPLAKAAFWTALAAVSHQFMLFLLPMSWLIVLGIQLVRTERLPGSLRNLLLLPAVAFLMSSWYFLPIFLTIGWPRFVAYPMEWYSVCSSLFPIVSSDLLRTPGENSCGNPLIFRYSLGMVAALILGIAGMVKLCLPIGRVRRNDPLLLSSAGLFLAVTGLILLVLWEPFPFLRQFSLSVGGGRLSLYLLLPMLFLSAALLHPGPTKRGALPANRLAPWLLLAILLPNLVWGLQADTFPVPELQYLESLGESADQRSREAGDLEDVFSWLSENASPEEGRILYQDTAYNFRGHPLFWSHIMAFGRSQTGLWSIGGSGQLFVPTDPATRTQGRFLFGRERDQITPDEIREGMRLFNCRWALTCEPELDALMAGSGFMDPVLERGDFTLYRNTDRGGWTELLEGDGVVEVLEQSDGRRILNARIESDGGALVLVKSSYHPWWRISVNGRDTAAETASADSLLRIRIPEKGSFRIVMEFRPPKILPALLTLLGFALAGFRVLTGKDQSIS